MADPTGEGLGDEGGERAPGLISVRPVAELPEAVRIGMEVSRQQLQVIGALSSMSWGKGLSSAMRRAVSQFCDRYGIDALTELDVLGGAFYINAEYYLRKLGELRRAGVVRDFWFEHIHADRRLLEDAKDEMAPPEVRAQALSLWYENRRKRVEQNAPEEAAAIAICYVQLADGGSLIKGCKWAGNKTSVQQPRSGGGSAPNPIAENNPTLFVESTSARRAMRQVTSHVEDGSKFKLPDFSAMDRELEEISETVRPILQQQAAVNERLELEARGGPRALGDGGYSADAEVTRPSGEAVHVVSDRPAPAAIAEATRAVTEPDPYTGQPATSGAPAARVAPDPGLLRSMPDGSIREVRAPVVEEIPLPSGLLDSLGLEDAPAAGRVRTAVKCPECERMVVDANDHDPNCSRFAD